jgi:hypothetical protein
LKLEGLGVRRNRNQGQSDAENKGTASWHAHGWFLLNAAGDAAFERSIVHQPQN